MAQNMPANVRSLEKAAGEGSVSTYVTAATTLKPYQQAVIITTVAASFALTLPNVSEARGCFISVHLIDANANAVTLQDQDESLDWADKTLDADADGILLYSDGQKWWVVTNDIA